MKFRSSHFILGFSAVLALAACDTPQVKDGQFWQRISASEAIYAQGPKAQQMLNRDISRCVIELRELERLGTVKDAIPMDPAGRVLSSDERNLHNWDTPEREGYLLSEQTDYPDFETCMLSKGWERVEHVPFDVAAKGRENFWKAHVDYEYDPEKHSGQHKQASTDEVGDYSEFND